MKRRAFIQSIGVTSLLGFGGWSSASVASTQTSLQSLTPVFEQLPQVMADARARHHQRQVAFAASERARSGPRVELTVDAEDDSHYPLLIGLGPRAEGVIDQISATALLQTEVGLYRTGQRAQQQAPNRLAQRLQKTSAAMLLIDPDDPSARDDAHIWARQLIDDAIDLRVALVLNTAQTQPSDPSWQAALGLPVIQVCSDTSGLDTTAIVSAMLPGLPFNRPTLVGVDPIDVRTLLNAGYRAWTTAVYSPPSENCVAAIARASANLPPFKPVGAFAWVTSSLEFNITEFDAIGQTLLQQTDHQGSVIHAPFLDPSYAEGERLLSLTYFGA